MSMQVFDEEHYSLATVYAPGTFTYTKEKVGMRYFMLGVRTLVDPNDPKDIDVVHALQDAITIEQTGGPGSFDFPNWDAASQNAVRAELLKRAAKIPDTDRMYGPKGKVDPERHLIGTATAGAQMLRRTLAMFLSSRQRMMGKRCTG